MESRHPTVVKESLVMQRLKSDQIRSSLLYKPLSLRERYSLHSSLVVCLFSFWSEDSTVVVLCMSEWNVNPNSIACTAPCLSILKGHIILSVAFSCGSFSSRTSTAEQRVAASNSGKLDGIESR